MIKCSFLFGFKKGSIMNNNRKCIICDIKFQPAVGKHKDFCSSSCEIAFHSFIDTRMFKNSFSYLFNRNVKTMRDRGYSEKEIHDYFFGRKKHEIKV